MKNFFILLCLLIVSCREIDQFVPILQEEVVFDFSKEFTEASDTLVYQLIGNTYNAVRTPKGTEFRFKSDMFLFENGDYCSCEDVTLQIIEVDKKRDYVVHQASTVTNDQLLISEGAYHVSASYKGKQLVLAPRHQICFILPTEKLDSEMELFYGDQSTNGFNWVPASQAIQTASTIKAGEWRNIDSTEYILGYECFSDRMSWINVEKFASDGTKNPLCVDLNDTYGGDNTVMFAVLKSEKSILQLYYDSSQQGFCTSNIPEGTHVYLVGVHKRADEEYELGFEGIAVGSNHRQFLDFTPTSMEEIKSLLWGL